MRTTDLQHRLNVLYAWKKWAAVNSGDELGDGATYRAVLDGCGITVRTLCYVMGLRIKFKGFDDTPYPTASPARTAALLAYCKDSVWQRKLSLLDYEEQRCLLEVIYFGNRAIAHPDDAGIPEHQVGPKEMTSAISTVIKLLKADSKLQAALAGVRAEFLEP